MSLSQTDSFRSSRTCRRTFPKARTLAPAPQWSPVDAPSATDNCTLQTLGSDINSGATFQEGTTTVIYTAIDIYGNTTTATFDVIITSTDSDGDGICDNGDNCSDQMACNYSMTPATQPVCTRMCAACAVAPASPLATATATATNSMLWETAVEAARPMLTWTAFATMWIPA